MYMSRRRSHVKEAVTGAAGVKRLFDLVKIRDKDLRCAFYYALGNTLVANDLEQASRIAYGGDKRWSRVVTMQVTPWDLSYVPSSAFSLLKPDCIMLLICSEAPSFPYLRALLVCLSSSEPCCMAR